MLRQIEPGERWPIAVIVGTAVIGRCSPREPADVKAGLFQSHLTAVRRETTLRKLKGHPQPAWFRPF